jgi:phosphoserine phosphatase
VDLAASYAYGDREADLPMLDAVGHPVAVNASKRLARIARENGWEMVRWREAMAGDRARDARAGVARGQAAQGAAR